MKRPSLAPVFAGLTIACSTALGEVYPHRWVYVARGLHKDQDVDDIRRIVRTASQHGLNGMVLAGGLDRLDLQPPHYFERLSTVKQVRWSDMLDPNHNAHGDYYLVEGDYAGSWNHVPKDLVIVCWYYDKRQPSLRHFSSLGLKTLAGAYYDGDPLDNPRGWLEALDQTPGAVGIMYTTWQNKYELLAPFGDLVSGKLPGND